MSVVDLYSVLTLNHNGFAYPSASYDVEDKRSMGGMYAIGVAASTSVASRGWLEIRDALAGTVEVSDV